MMIQSRRLAESFFYIPLYSRGRRGRLPHDYMKIQQIVKAAALVFAAALWGCAGNRGSYEHPVVETSAGRVQGFIDDSVAVFKGVPYAEAERFMPPHEPAKWDTVMMCTHFGDIAPQPPVHAASCYIPSDTLAHMGEDCLNLNIWTPVRRATSGRPVMVWLHGGAFDYGSSHQHLTFDGKSLARTDDVVIVTLNHRLNALGFLDLSAYGTKYAESGNLGMLDILQALKWIKANIAAFGGDPDNITLFGHGSGGVKVMTLMAMPEAKGYYHKVIIQSGTLEGMYQHPDVSRRIAELTMKEANADSPEALARLPFDSLWAASNRAIDRIYGERPGIVHGSVKFAPVVDGNILPKPIFSDSAINVDADVPVIIGSTFSEFTTSEMLLEPDRHDVTGIYEMTEEEVEAEFDKRYGTKKDDIKLAFAMAYPDRAMRELLMMDTKVRSLVLRIAHMFAQRRARLRLHVLVGVAALQGLRHELPLLRAALHVQQLRPGRILKSRRRGSTPTQPHHEPLLDILRTLRQPQQQHHPLLATHQPRRRPHYGIRRRNASRILPRPAADETSRTRER